MDFRLFVATVLTVYGIETFHKGRSHHLTHNPLQQYLPLMVYDIWLSLIKTNFYNINGINQNSQYYEMWYWLLLSNLIEGIY